MERPFYTTEEIAKMFGIKKQTVYNYIYRQKLPARKWGGRWIVLKEDLEKFFTELPLCGGNYHQK